MKRRLIIFGSLVALFILLQFRPHFFKTHAEATAAAERETEILVRLYDDSAAIQRGEWLPARQSSAKSTSWA